MAASTIELHIEIFSPGGAAFTSDVTMCAIAPFESSFSHSLSHFLRARCMRTASDRSSFFSGGPAGASGVPGVGSALAAFLDFRWIAIVAMSIGDDSTLTVVAWRACGGGTKGLRTQNSASRPGLCCYHRQTPWGRVKIRDHVPRAPSPRAFNWGGVARPRATRRSGGGQSNDLNDLAHYSIGAHLVNTH